MKFIEEDFWMKTGKEDTEINTLIESLLNYCYDMSWFH